MRNKIRALLIKPRLWLALFLLKFMPANHAVVKSKNQLGEIRWFIFTESKDGKLLCVTWNAYADHWKDVLKGTVMDK